MNTVKKTERGWAGHFCCADRCLFRRNTLVEYKDKKIVVSTVGLMKHYNDKDQYEEIGLNRYYETMVFEADYNNTRYYDADVEKQISFDSNWAISEIDADDKANAMHDNVVKEISENLVTGVI